MSMSAFIQVDMILEKSNEAMDDQRGFYLRFYYVCFLFLNVFLNSILKEWTIYSWLQLFSI